MNPSATVSAFCNALAANDLDAAMLLVAPDCVYHNIPLPPMQGADQIRATLAGFVQLLGCIRIETVRQVAEGEWVMNERIDHFNPPGGKAYGLPVAGSFRVQNGLITVWHDYFDLKQFSAGTGITL